MRLSLETVSSSSLMSTSLLRDASSPDVCVGTVCGLLGVGPRGGEWGVGAGEWGLLLIPLPRAEVETAHSPLSDSSWDREKRGD